MNPEDHNMRWIRTEHHSNGRLAVVIDEWRIIESAIEAAINQARLEVGP